MVGETANRRGPSEREQLIIQRVAEGCKNREIADSLGTTEHVVKNYLRLIYDKLGLWNRVELALWYEARQHEQVYHASLALERFVGAPALRDSRRGMSITETSGRRGFRAGFSRWFSPRLSPRTASAKHAPPLRLLERCGGGNRAQNVEQRGIRRNLQIEIDKAVH
jgi:DNA-binding CsgD family transcriptional regulator